MQEEQWKTIESFPLYEVSNLGRVRGIKGKILNCYDKGGYLKVQIKNPEDKIQKKPSIHRLVALAFIPNPANKPDVHHIDHNKYNNRADNLVWVTPEEHRAIHLGLPLPVEMHCPRKYACPAYYEYKGALFTNLSVMAGVSGISRSTLTRLIKDNPTVVKYHPPKFFF